MPGRVKTKLELLPDSEEKTRPGPMFDAMSILFDFWRGMIKAASDTLTTVVAVTDRTRVAQTVLAQRYISWHVRFYEVMQCQENIKISACAESLYLFVIHPKQKFTLIAKRHLASDIAASHGTRVFAALKMTLQKNGTRDANAMMPHMWMS
jgi:hypothetical protein